MKYLKYSLAAAGVLALAAAAFVAYFVVTFDVRDYEPRIVALVKEKTGRTLIIRGDTRLAFWPDLGVTLGPVALSERGSDAVFAEVANARFVAKLKPLLSKALVADELYLEGASVRIIRYPDGRLNIDDLLGGEGGPPQFDIARARAQRSSVVYEDARTGVRHELHDVDLTTGRLTHGTATPIALSFTARDAARSYSVSSAIQGRLTFDLERRTYRMQTASVKVDGSFGGVSGIALMIDVGMLDIANGAIAAEAVAADARAADWHALVKAPRVEWRDGVVRAGDAAIDMDAARDGRKLHASIVGAVSAAIAAQAIELTNLRAKFAATGSGLPKRGIEGTLSGAASVDVRGDRAEAAFAGVVLDSRIKAKLAAKGLASPSYTFALDVDALDLDRLGALSAGPKSAEPFDVAKLADFGAEGVVRIGSLRSAGVVARNVQLAMKP